MKQHRKNNCQKILNYIKVNGSINFKQCERSKKDGGLGISRLAARIWDIKNIMGIDIKTTMNYSNNERFATYTRG